MNISIQNDVSEVGGMIDYLSLQSQVTIKEKEYRSMMAKNNLTGGGVQIIIIHYWTNACAVVDLRLKNCWISLGIDINVYICVCTFRSIYIVVYCI